MSSFKRSNDIYEAYKIFKVHENDLLIAEDEFLNHIRNLIQYAEKEGKLDDVFQLLKNSESFKKNIYIKSFIIYLMGTKLYNKRNASKLEIENAINLIEESAGLG
ncbi:28796_t:CDS:1, partial [Dentiscutata erythropus]